MTELDPQHRALDPLHPIVEPLEGMVILPLLAPVAQHADPLGEVLVVGDHHAALAAGPEVLPGIEAEAAHVADGAHAPALVLRAVGLGSIFDDDEVMAAGDVQDGVEIRGLAMQVHRQDRLGAVGDRRLDLGDVHVEGVGVNVDEHRAGAGVVDRRHGRDEGAGDRDDLVPRTDPGRQEGQVQGAGAGVDADAEAPTAVGGKLLLERGDLLAQNELGGRQGLLDGGEEVLLDAAHAAP